MPGEIAASIGVAFVTHGVLHLFGQLNGAVMPVDMAGNGRALDSLTKAHRSEYKAALDVANSLSALAGVNAV
jgi:hypothetical protein